MRIGGRAALAGSAFVAIIAVQACNNSGSSPVGPGGNTPPVVSSVSADPTRVTPGGSTLVIVSAVDADGDTFECSWTSSTGGSFNPQSTDRCRTQWQAPAQGGAARLDVTVRDRRGASTSASVDVTVEVPSSASGPQPGPTPTPEPPGSGPNPSPTPSPGPTPAPSPSPTPGPEPVIASFTASPSSITSGQASTLSWSTKNTTSVTIDHGIGSVALSGNVQVQPTVTTVYTLTASGGAGTVSGTTTVVVGQPSCTPPTVSLSGGGSCHPQASAPCTVDFSAAASGSATLQYQWGGCCSGSGANGTCSISRPGSATCSITVTNSCGSASAQGSATGTNATPTVSASGGGSCHPRPDAPCSTNVSASGSDPDGDPLTYTWAGCASGSGANSTCSVSQLGANMATVTATDPFGASQSANVGSQGTNQGPNVTGGQMWSAANFSCRTARATKTDPDGDPLTCAWAVGDGGAGQCRPNCGGCGPGDATCAGSIDPAVPQDACTMAITCTDPWGVSESETWTINRF